MACKRDQSIKLKKYLRYVIQRVAYLKAGIYSCSDNQYNYFFNLLESIYEWSRHHKLFWKFLLGKLTLDQLKDLLGEPERQTFRYLQRQRENLINFIQTEEIKYYAKYPFEDKLVFQKIEVEEDK
jgi:hypothetical protein